MSVLAIAEGSARYTVSSNESWLTFNARTTLHAVHGKAADLEGFIESEWDADGALALQPAPRMHVDLLVEHLHSGNAIQDREMWKLIDSKRFSRIAADLRELQPAEAPGRYSAMGDITLAGRTRRYSGELTFIHEAGVVTIEGGLDVDIRDFGLKPPSLIFMKVDPWVNVRLHLVARAA